jgi:hypothetical protein
MPSVVGLLEQHELAARRRVDGPREEADRIQDESLGEPTPDGGGVLGVRLACAVLVERGSDPSTGGAHPGDVLSVSRSTSAWVQPEEDTSPTR